MLKLSKELYTDAAIGTAVSVYANLAKVNVGETQGYWELDFINCQYDADLTAREFENYVIGVMNQS